MSIISTIIAGFVLFIRKLTNEKISPKCNWFIWCAFIIALIFPVSVPSKISIYNYIGIDNVKFEQNEKNNKSWNLKDEIYNFSNKNINDVIYNISSLSTLKKINMIIPNIWIIMCIFYFTKNICAYIFLNNFITNNEIKDEKIIRIFEDCKNNLKIKKNIKLLKQSYIKSPSITGIFNVKILLTEKILELDDNSINNIFMHELSHYKRKDNILNFLIIIIKSIYWFNPFINKIFKNLKNDIELATDEMAINKMSHDQQIEYCKVMVTVSGMCSRKNEYVFGLAEDVKTLEKRINMISNKEKFDKYSKSISFSTIVIVLLMWFLLYPTSYGKSDVPKLFIELENQNKIELSNYEDIKTIEVDKGSELEVIFEGGKPNKYILYNQINLINNKLYKGVENIFSTKLKCFDTGEYLYEFIVEYGKNKNISYIVNVIVK